MSRHGNDPLCPLCEEKLATAHPELSKWYRNHVKTGWPYIHVAHAYRNQEDQEKAFREGGSYLHFPNSKHNHQEDGRPCSLALDLFEQKNGLGIWSPRVFNEIAQMCRSAELPILWGGSFKSLGDLDHFQLHFPE